MNLFKIKKIICFIHIFVFIIQYHVISIAVNMTAVGSFSRFRFRVLAHFSQYNRVSPSKTPMVQRWSVLTKDSLVLTELPKPRVKTKTMKIRYKLKI